MPSAYLKRRLDGEPGAATLVFEAAVGEHPHVREPVGLGEPVRAGEEQRRGQAVGERGVAGDDPGGDDLGGRRARSGVEDMVEPVPPGAPVDGGRAQRAIGDLELTYEVLALPADPGLSLVVYGAEPGSASQDGLRLLASWAATLDLAATRPSG